MWEAFKEIDLGRCWGMSDLEITMLIQKFAEENDLYSKEVRNLLSEGGVERLISQYKTISRRLDKMSAENRELQKNVKDYEDKISKLEKDVANYKQAFEDKCADYGTVSELLGKYQQENEGLKQRIAELESEETETCEKEPISDCKQPSIEWYDNRHQSDCIEINRLNTAIDVLIHKVEYLRQFAGLE